MTAMLSGKVYKKGGNKKTDDIDPGMGGSHPGVSQGNGFKKGGLVGAEKKIEKAVEKKENKVIKTAFTKHDKFKHDGEKATEVANLCSGGKIMKKGGKATKYKARKK